MKKIVYLLLLTTIIFSSCKKGNIDIESSGFWVNNCTAPFEVQFYLNIHYQPKEITYNWDFGDGNTSTEKEPSHIYTKTGVYNVKLTIVNYKQTLEKTYSLNISQDPMPIEADFDYQSKYGKYFAPTEIEFINNSQYASSFSWNFGDDRGSAETSPTHIFNTAGTYNVYLYATCNGDTDTSLFQLEIAPPPTTISVDVVSIWLPEQYLGGLFELHYFIGSYNETPYSIDAVEASDFPFGWIIGDDLYSFDGNYDTRILSFEITDYYNNNYPVYSFVKKFSEIQDAFYPDTLFFDGSDGYSAEIILSYE